MKLQSDLPHECVLQDEELYVTGIETKFAGSSCNDLVTSDGAGSTIISGHFDQRIRFWDTRAESSSNDIVLEGKVTSLDLSRGKYTII
jgi:autophagy-related protein 16